LIRVAAGLLLALAVAGAAGSAIAEAARDASMVIRPGRAIGTFRLGMTEQQVRRAAGRPTYVIPR
jgi:hypothetical protein